MIASLSSHRFVSMVAASKINFKGEKVIITFLNLISSADNFHATLFFFFLTDSISNIFSCFMSSSSRDTAIEETRSYVWYALISRHWCDIFIFVIIYGCHNTPFFLFLFCFENDFFSVIFSFISLYRIFLPNFGF